MGFPIEDGTGKGYQAKVNKGNMLSTLAITNSMEHHTNHAHGDSYNLLFSQIADTTGSCIVYIKNSDEKDMIFEGITANVLTDETLEIVLNNVGTPVGGVEVTPTNLNAGVNNVADGVFQSGSDITELDGGSVIFRFFFKGGETSKHCIFEQDIIIPKNRTLTICCVNGSILVDGFLSFFFHEII